MNKRQKQIYTLSAKIDNLQDKIDKVKTSKEFMDIQIKSLEKAYNNLALILVESGIIETEWKPTAPKGSSIIHNEGYRWKEPTYTKINKVL